MAIRQDVMKLIIAEYGSYENWVAAGKPPVGGRGGTTQPTDEQAVDTSVTSTRPPVDWSNYSVQDQVARMREERAAREQQRAARYAARDFKSLGGYNEELFADLYAKSRSGQPLTSSEMSYLIAPANFQKFWQSTGAPVTAKRKAEVAAMLAERGVTSDSMNPTVSTNPAVVAMAGGRNKGITNPTQAASTTNASTSNRQYDGLTPEERLRKWYREQKQQEQQQQQNGNAQPTTQNPAGPGDSAAQASQGQQGASTNTQPQTQQEQQNQLTQFRSSRTGFSGNRRYHPFGGN